MAAMSTRGRSMPPLPIGGSGLPNLDNFDYEHTSTKQTETNQISVPPSRHPSHPVLTVIGGPDAGRVVSLMEDEAVVLGRGTNCTMMLPDAGVSRQHARVTRRDRRFFVEDLNSKNGTFVDGGEVSRSRQIEIGSTIQVGPNVLIRLVLMTVAEEMLARQLYDSSMRDPLTGTYNRRYMMDRLHAEISFAIRHRGALSLGIIDLDDFKEVNDTRGHPVGDEVLVHSARTIAATLRSEDVLARIGGEEFAFVLRGIPHDEALKCAERIRAAIAAQRVHLVDSPWVGITISVGVAAIDDCAAAPSAESLFAVADERLYAAKRSGKNRVRGRA
jgi:diguanylate cyclase (GGDEF)-like protein